MRVEESPLLGPRRVKLNNKMKDSEEPNIDLIGAVWPLRMLQMLGLWQPSGIPKVLGWIYYLVLFGLVTWYNFWVVWFTARRHNIAVGIIHAFDNLMFWCLWIFLPWTIYRKSRTFVNTVEYLQLRKTSFIVFCICYTIAFVLLLSPHIAYTSLYGVAFVKDQLAPNLPWHTDSTYTVDVTLLIFGMVLNIFCINTTLLFLGVNAHLQSFQIKDFLNNHLRGRGTLKLNHVKHVLHLVIRSLKDGNGSVEPINAVMTLGLFLEIAAISTKLVLEDQWDIETIIPLLLLLVQIYFFLLPPAFISACWDRVFHECLALHALAPTPAEELGSIITYMQNTFAGYTITNVRVDKNKILYFTFLVILLVGIKIQSDVGFWIIY